MNTNKSAKLATKILEWQARRSGKAQIFYMDTEHLTSEFVFCTWCAKSKYRFIAWLKFVRGIRSLLKGSGMIKWEGKLPEQGYNLVWREKPQFELAQNIDDGGLVWIYCARLCVKDRWCKIPYGCTQGEWRSF